MDRPTASSACCYDYVQCHDEDKLIALYSTQDDDDGKYDRGNNSAQLQFWSKALFRYARLRRTYRFTQHELVSAFTTPTGIFPSSFVQLWPTLVGAGNIMESSKLAESVNLQAQSHKDSSSSGGSSTGVMEKGINAVASVFRWLTGAGGGGSSAGTVDDRAEFVSIELLREMTRKYLLPKLLGGASSGVYFINNFEKEDSTALSLSELLARLTVSNAGAGEDSYLYASVLQQFVENCGVCGVVGLLVNIERCAAVNDDLTIVKLFDGRSGSAVTAPTDSECARVKLQRAIVLVESSISTVEGAAGTHKALAIRLKVRFECVVVITNVLHFFSDLEQKTNQAQALFHLKRYKLCESRKSMLLNSLLGLHEAVEVLCMNSFCVIRKFWNLLCSLQRLGSMEDMIVIRGIARHSSLVDMADIEPTVLRS
jgi:hypothetical protein